MGVPARGEAMRGVQGGVARNERGYRIGEGHHRATVPDAVVNEMRRMHESEGLTYREIVERFRERGVAVTWRNVRAICSYMRRVPAWRMVR